MTFTTFLIIALVIAVWLLIGWLVLDDHIDISNEFLWLVCFGVPVIILVFFRLLLDLTRDRGYR